MNLLFYRLHRYQISDVRIGRLLVATLLIVGLGASGGVLPGGLWLASGCLVLLIGYFGAGIYFQRRSYLDFTAESKPAVQPKRLSPSAKIPVIASGLFGVEGKYRHFTWLEGYFRTFATREHALLCLVKPDRVGLVATWPEGDIGMWYIFMKDKSIQNVRWGRVRFGKKEATCIAVKHKIVIPKKGRFSRERTLFKTAYIAVSNQADALAIYADLLWQSGMDEGSHADVEDELGISLHAPPTPYVNGNGAHVTERNDPSGPAQTGPAQGG